MNVYCATTLNLCHCPKHAAYKVPRFPLQPLVGSKLCEGTDTFNVRCCVVFAGRRPASNDLCGRIIAPPNVSKNLLNSCTYAHLHSDKLLKRAVRVMFDLAQPCVAANSYVQRVVVPDSPRRPLFRRVFDYWHKGLAL